MSLKFLTLAQVKEHFPENKTKNVFRYNGGVAQGITREQARLQKFFECEEWGTANIPKQLIGLQWYPFGERSAAAFLKGKKKVALGDDMDRECKFEFTSGPFKGKFTVFMTATVVLARWHGHSYHAGEDGITYTETGDDEADALIVLAGYFADTAFSPLDLPTQVSARTHLPTTLQATRQHATTRHTTHDARHPRFATAVARAAIYG